MDANDCAALSTRNDFSGYTALVRNVTGGNFSLLAECREEICGALWGSGNSDISGVGMAAGYILETVICTTIVCTFIAMRCQPRYNTSLARLLVSNAANTFYDNAIFFTFAIQLASISTLTMANFGVTTAGMGAITMKIAWLVSTLTLLPLLPFVLLPDLFLDGNLVGAGALASGGAIDSLNTASLKYPSDSVRAMAKKKARRGERFLLFVFSWALSFYPFFSRMNGTFGKSQIGDSPESAISKIDWGFIEAACFKDVQVLSSGSETAMTAFGIASWLLVTIIVVYKILLSAMKDSFQRQRKWLKNHNLAFDADAVNGFGVWLAMNATVFIFLIMQFWAFFRLRRFQSDILEAAGGKFPDGQWTFGQIVSIVVFIPVIVEVLFLWKKRSLYCS